ncbi:alpha-amylase [Danxiaibacter flavus]|uniref:Alpha-amylase n=1 Tax=Danxiaibacter flavus TaxID=3049108 RepID=A0ABV3ZGJ6_9BACT|nr:alpha-amylase [Chitinophagaceae bacterium DXS]
MLNGTMLQYFHWYSPADGSVWNKLKDEAKNLSEMGITSVWLPPAYKSTEGGFSPGYDVYDIYDLGEFDQKGSVRTKYGTRDEYIEAVNAARAAGLRVYIDVVLNHMGGADETEKIPVRKVDPEDRNKFISDTFEIEAFTKFTFPARKGKYSQFIWDHSCFSGIDYAKDLEETAIFSIQNEYGPGWEDGVDEEMGNYDYLMFADIEFRNPAVREELKRWGKWYYDTVQFDGVRLDAVKHINQDFYKEWLDFMRAETKDDLFAVGEYWFIDLNPLLNYIDVTEGRMSLFDVPLHNNFHKASNAGKDYDLTTIFNDTLVATRPELAVTLVDNHDTQPLQALEAPVEAWFKPIAYALILLRAQGYPCIFYPDLFSATYTDKGGDGNDYEIFLPACDKIDKLILARKQYAYGEQRDYLDHPNCIGFTREGVDEVGNSGCAVIISNSEDGFKTMDTGARNAGKTFIDLLGNHEGEIKLDEDGCGEFQVMAGSVSVWVQKP